jgi:hypothetical protein
MMTADEFRKWIANCVVAGSVILGVVLGFPAWPLWAYIVIGFVGGIVFPVAPAANKEVKA